MKYDRKTKEGWIDDIARQLAPVLLKLGFRQSGKRSFVKKQGLAKKQYLLMARHPGRSVEGGTQLFIDHYANVQFAELNDLTGILNGRPLQAGFATFGGSVSRIIRGNWKDWPVDGPSSANRLVKQFRSDVVKHVVPFWEQFDTPEHALATFRAARDWPWGEGTTIAALHYVVEGADSALEYFQREERRFPAHLTEDEFRRLLAEYSGNAKRKPKG